MWKAEELVERWPVKAYPDEVLNEMSDEKSEILRGRVVGMEKWREKKGWWNVVNWDA